MKEEFLHYIWKFQLFNKIELRLISGEPLEIIQVGFLNSDSGPDFFNGIVKIGETKWAGNIEIHINSSDWLNHKHQIDEAYDKVILHVVWNNNRTIRRKSGELIPCLELKGLVHRQILDNYNNLQNKFQKIPCEKSIGDVDAIILSSYLERLTIERLQNKAERLNRLLEFNKNDWEASTYQLIAKYFGFKVNAVPFELLVLSLPYSIIRKHTHNLIELEALLFGQAGFFEFDYNGSYPNELKVNYSYLRKKYQLKPINNSLWKFMRMRPSNFPTIRIAQFAKMLHLNGSIFKQIVDAKNLKELKKIFDVCATNYWNSHFRFDVPSSSNEPRNLGDSSVNILLINTIIPLLFLHGRKRADELIGEQVLEHLLEIQAEQNKVVRVWKTLGIIPSSAMQTQALLQLKSNYCDLKKCLNCGIGNSIIKLIKND